MSNMKERISLRVLAVFLTVTLLLGMLPTGLLNVFAEGTGAVSITVQVEDETGNALEGVSVKLVKSDDPGENVTAISDSIGVAQFDNLYEADYTFEANLTDYETATGTISVISSNSYIIRLAKSISTPVIDSINSPDAINPGETLTLGDPNVYDGGAAITAQGWQINNTGSFTDFDTNTVLDMTYDSVLLRYYATNSEGTGYSNEVEITVEPYSTALSLSAAPESPQTYPASVVLTARLTGADDNQGKDINFYINGSKAETVVTDENGTAEFTVSTPSSSDYTFGADYTGDTNNSPSNATQITYSLNKANPAINLSDSKTGNIYNGGIFEIGAAEVSGVTGGAAPTGAVIYTYYTDAGKTDITTAENSGSLTTGGAPEFAGTYYVDAVIAADTNYNSANKTALLVIDQKELTVNGLVAANRAYNGLTEVTLSGGTLEGIIGSDDVTAVMPITGNVSDASAGNNKSVTYDTITLNGIDKNNYSLIQPAVTVNIQNGFTPEKDSHYTVSLPDGNDGWFRASDFIITAKTGYSISLGYLDSSSWSDKLTFSSDTDNSVVTFYVRNSMTMEISAAASELYKLDRTAPTKQKISYSSPILGKLLGIVSFGFYKEQMTVTVSADDVTSGVSKISYTCALEDNVSQKNTGKTGEVTGLTPSGNTFTGSFPIDPQYRGRISFTATDLAGNVSNIFDGTDTVVVDNISPAASVTYNAPVNSANGTDYYNNDVTATIKIDEANFFADQVNLTVKKDGSSFTPATEADWTQAGDIWTKVIKLPAPANHTGDGDYVIAIDYTDYSGNQMTPYVKNNITIDTTNPVINVSYGANETVNNLKYFNKDRTATIKVTEHNWNPDAVAIAITAEDLAGNDVTPLPVPGTWTDSGDEHTVSITYSADANYTFVINCTDHATNVNDPVDYGTSIAPTDFTVDHTAPTTLNISYSTPLLEKVLNSVSFGFYKERMTVTVTADDVTSGVDKLSYTCDVEDNSSPKNTGKTGEITAPLQNGNTFTGSFQIDPQYRGKISFTATDCAGNVSNTFYGAQTVVVDDISPVASVTYNAPINSNGTDFYKSDVTATIKIDEANFWADQVNISVKKDGSSFTPVTVADWSQAGDIWTRVIKLPAPADHSGDGDYDITIDYTDYSSNQMAQYAKNNITIDTTNPVVNVSYEPGETVMNSNNFDKNRTAAIKVTEHNWNPDAVKVDITAKDLVGNDITPLPVLGTWTDTGEDEYTAYITYSNDAQYTFTVNYTDYATNANDPVDYGTSLAPTDFVVDHAAPTGLKISYSTPVLLKVIDAVTFGFYKEQMTVTVSADDATSGVKKIEYQCILDPNVSPKNTEKKGEIIDPTQNGNTFTGNFPIDPQFRGKVSFNATDLAGNKSVTYNGTQTIVVDNISPKISIQYSAPSQIIDKTTSATLASETADAQLYYKDDVTATIAVDEANFWADQVAMTVTRDGSDYTPAVVTDWSQAGDVWTKVIKLTGEGDYSVSLTCSDYSGNAGEFNDGYSTGTASYTRSNITIDKTAPTISVSYGDANTLVQTANGHNYFKAARTATIVVTEHNFRAGDIEAIVTAQDLIGTDLTAKNLTGTDVTVEDFNAYAKNPANWSHDVDKHTLQLPFTVDANYTFDFAATAFKDRALNEISKNDVSYTDTYITGSKGPSHNFAIDTTNPEDVTITYTNSTLESFLQSISFGFYKAPVTVVLSASDKTSGIEKIDYEYKVSENVSNVNQGGSGTLTFNSSDAAKALTQNNYEFTGSFVISAQFRGTLLIKATDFASNEQSQNVGKDGATGKDIGGDVVVDDKIPQVTVEYNAPTQITDKTSLSTQTNETANSQLYYAGDVTAKITINEANFWPVDKDTGEENVVINVKRDGADYSYQTLNNNADKGWIQSTGDIWTKEIVLSDDGDYDISIQYVDYSNNEANFNQGLFTKIYNKNNITIDKTKPDIEVTYKNNDVKNDKYFQADRTATIKLTEHNFRASDVSITYTASNLLNADQQASILNYTDYARNPANWINDGDVHTLNITYSIEAEYTFDITCKDLAQNSNNPVTYPGAASPQLFVVDKTLPVLAISYNNNNAKNNNYFDASRTATINVTEHNWNSNEFVLKLLSEDNSSGTYRALASPGLSSWTDNGDVHTATITFTSDARYTLSGEYTDLAANKGNNIDQHQFFIDNTNPVVPQTLAQISVDSYVNGAGKTVAPNWQVTDNNIDTMTYTISGKDRNGNAITTIPGSSSDITNGKRFAGTNIPEEAINDGIYTVKITAVDKAGRTTTSPDFTFSVNRFGSTFDLSSVNSVSKGYYKSINDVVFTEVNPNTVADDAYVLTISCNGNIRELTLGTDFTRVNNSPANGKWSEYTYTINKDVFKEDGLYIVTLRSKDEANNDNSSNNENQKGSLITFTIDNTPPAAAVTGVDPVKGGAYQMAELPVTITATDNLKLKSLTIKLNGNEIKTYTAKEDEIETSFKADIVIPSDTKTQTLEINCEDAAGNILPVMTIGNINVNSNPLVLYYLNKPLFFGSIGGLALIIIGLAAFFIFRKKAKA